MAPDGMGNGGANSGVDPDRALFWRIDSFAGPMKAVRKREWKYVIDGNTQLLFDLDW